jgi:TrmH family RNA methyltransferase
MERINLFSMKTLSSLKNSHFKRLKKLSNNNFNKKESEFIIEGFKEVKLAIRSNFKISKIYFREEIPLELDLFIREETEIFFFKKHLFDLLSYRKNSSKLIAVADKKYFALEDILLKKTSIVIIIENIEKPGNLGAILRTADGMNVSGIIIVDSKINIYNSNVIRSSVGSVFNLPIVKTNKDEAIKFLIKNNFNLYNTIISKDSKNYLNICYSGNIALAFGSENKGLSDNWKSYPANKICIKMNGKNDSFNLSVSVGIILSEVVRQTK